MKMWCKILFLTVLIYKLTEGVTIDFDNDIQFLLFTKNVVKYPHQLFINDNDTLTLSDFKSRRITFILIHEWGTGIRSVHLTPIKLALLTSGDYNVLQVDWHNEAMLSYPVARKYVSAIGEYVEKFLRFLINSGRVKTSQINIITYGLAAHIAGNAVKNIIKINKIIALNPQNNLFSEKNDDILKATNARCVDAIYSTMNELSKNFIDTIAARNIFITSEKIENPYDFNLGDFYAERILRPSLMSASKCDNLNTFTKGICTVSRKIFIEDFQIKCYKGYYYI